MIDLVRAFWRRRVRPWVAHDTRRGRFGILAVLVYLAIATMSVLYGVSGGTGPANELGAEIAWDAEGAGRLVVQNRGDDDWSEVRVDLDGRYYAEREGLGHGETLTLTGQEVLDGYELPRADGLFEYERLYPRPARPVAGLPDGYSPRTVTLRAAQGAVTQRF